MISSLGFSEDEINKAVNDIKPYVNFLHLDIMDGKFVKEKTCTVNILKKIKSKINIDIHLMTEDIVYQIDKVLRIKKVFAINFHHEACENEGQAIEIIESIKLRGIKAGVVINPETDVNKIKGILPFCDQVLVMSVHPGKGSQGFIPKTLNKIRKIRALAPGIKIHVDGGIKLFNAEKIVKAGADRIIVGSAITKSGNIINAIKEFNRILK